MTSKTQVAKPRRARTADQKQDRRAAILAAAIACTRESGFDGVTMSGLAKRAGLAKGTLYLYFETREEVFLALYLEALGAWAARIAEALAPGIDDEAAVEALTRVARDDRLFVELASRLASVIEQNVPLDTLIEAKRNSLPIYMGLAGTLEDRLGFAPGDGLRFGSAMVAQLLGAAQIDTGDLATRDALPEDIRGIVAVSRFETVFADGLRLLLAGMRRRPRPDAGA
ncbi:TetR/AcrR family transcriptional regulator [Bauldia litoralis]|uniref:Transcriptional regulator, TetR family n=1 Tax=Bauldia litoralis TaxID=665467 RepID=A0A1G6CUI1_9HYPH|nr:TetR family transcriptional regulator [Bauldia litoralis]SDB36529.1 transcriptional regulator, TetR family [Bauldia litoralis]